MTDQPKVLVCNRLTDMVVMHPQQDDTHVCSKCGYPVGIYPTGQRALKKWPDTPIMCQRCVQTISLPTDIKRPAGTFTEVILEIWQSKPVIKQ